MVSEAGCCCGEILDKFVQHLQPGKGREMGREMGEQEDFILKIVTTGELDSTTVTGEITNEKETRNGLTKTEATYRDEDQRDKVARIAREPMHNESMHIIASEKEGMTDATRRRIVWPRPEFIQRAQNRHLTTQ